MFGSLVGSIIASQFSDEKNPNKSKDFELFDSRCTMVPATVVALATGKAILDSRDVYSCLDAREVIAL